MQKHRIEKPFTNEFKLTPRASLNYIAPLPRDLTNQPVR